nr:protein MAIN-LIKE 1-like [Ipomoea batatas]
MQQQPGLHVVEEELRSTATVRITWPPRILRRPRTAGDVVTTDYLSILMDINDIKNYAWGAAALAHLHASLESCKKEKKGGTKMYGLVFPLMLFFIEHVPQLRNAILYSAPPPKVDPLPMNFPLMCVDWQPYGRLDAAFIPHAYGGQMQYAMSRTVLMCFDTCVYHRPHLSPMQFGILVGSENALHDEINLHVIKHHGPKGKDFTKYNINIGRKRANYDEMFKEWERRDLCVLNRDGKLC